MSGTLNSRCRKKPTKSVNFTPTYFKSRSRALYHNFYPCSRNFSPRRSLVNCTLAKSLKTSSSPNEMPQQRVRKVEEQKRTPIDVRFHVSTHRMNGKGVKEISGNSRRSASLRELHRYLFARVQSVVHSASPSESPREATSKSSPKP